MFNKNIRENSLSEMLKISYTNPPILEPRAYMYARDVISEGLNSSRGVPSGLCIALAVVAKHYIQSTNLSTSNFKSGYNLFKAEIIDLLKLCRSYEEDALYIVILTLGNGEIAGGNSKWYGTDKVCQNCIEVGNHHINWYHSKAKESLNI